MNILVTGANGQLGNEIQLIAKNSNDNYIFTDVCDGYSKLDITNIEDIRKTIAENSIENPEDIKGFKRLGYAFRPDLSSEIEYIFERKIETMTR